MIVVATILNALVIFKRGMREFAMVGIWALIAIAVRNWEVENVISYVAVFCGANLFVLVSYHGFKNRKTNPFYLMLKK